MWSNIHYGFVGRAAHFTGGELREGARKRGGINDQADEVSVNIGIPVESVWEGFDAKEPPVRHRAGRPTIRGRR